uniref:Thioredoxin domain-containing protein n=1 Tax=Pyramimonas obovata TaxID=1411642 RepID=A0A7S0RF77_9CHLO|mmetsp:Transcript_32884/g.71722  ORF Transcript_32884/g.71722 Transcript_32884/m.71722 type:complete len:164 (+) Transcript_32884:130-621(+)|eukprot:CAMPEP_0118931734 /NCGR_PEP_ID=MMETSP1169-20130426/7971_1 /TAXON_ID=36882 /ORGANISM="Pyramimonas obovata, Strain CCMP722" /LENGTH=163 /DNA_ID=CAMNT_0006874267 /DNA_START=130 /DNA_END=621 /DNA_ORIENTATION=-
MASIQEKLMSVFESLDVEKLKKSPALMVLLFIAFSRLLKILMKRYMGAKHAGPPGGNVKEVHSKEEWAEEFRKAKEENKLVVVDFSASWCGPCRYLAPKFAALSVEYVDEVFLKVDVDKCQGISREQKVAAMPTIKAYRDGVCVQTVQGALYNEIVAMIKKHL